jgi:hypothetical protein
MKTAKIATDRMAARNLSDDVTSARLPDLEAGEVVFRLRRIERFAHDGK